MNQYWHKCLNFLYRILRSIVGTRCFFHRVADAKQGCFTAPCGSWLCEYSGHEQYSTLYPSAGAGQMHRFQLQPSKGQMGFHLSLSIKTSSQLQRQRRGGVSEHCYLQAAALPPPEHPPSLNSLALETSRSWGARPARGANGERGNAPREEHAPVLSYPKEAASLRSLFCSHGFCSGVPYPMALAAAAC